MKFQSVISNLQSGTAVFGYIKSDGSIRFAVGTTNHTILDNFDALPMEDQVVHSDKINYFDLIKQEWRSFKKDRLVYTSEYGYNLGLDLRHVSSVNQFEDLIGM